ncbi:MAG: AglZ/HisF2 family acetamidino modification protein [Planctomycetota bacterium]|nr:AglZ/HisF2 family acetamidino modification protein [Planctomycetota bacterium]
MKRIRVIPTLLLKSGGVVKTTQFRHPTYVGDPINAVKIFNEKEVDELILLDIDASRDKRPPDFRMVEQIASECFMPVAYGGGISDIEQMRILFSLGVEKVVINSALSSQPEMIRCAANTFGSQSIVASIDAKKTWRKKYKAVTSCGTKYTGRNVVEMAKMAVEYGVGEIYLNSMDRDGTQRGYDIPLVKDVSDAVPVPIIAAGGAHSITDFFTAVSEANASAVSAGSMFVFHGIHRAVLISYPNQDILMEQLYKKVA